MSVAKSENEEMEGLMYDNKQLAFKENDLEFPPDKDLNLPSETEKCEHHFLDNETFELEKSEDLNVEIKLWRNKKVINKSLLAFRLTQFIWFGAGSLPGTFLGIFLKQRGLTLIELSSAYSMIFLLQLVLSSVTGIITDKIGNAKPVLIFMMLSTSSILIFMLIMPDLNNVSCTTMEKSPKFINVSEGKQNFSACFNQCLQENNKHETQESFTKISVSENISLFEKFNLVADNDKTFCKNITLNDNSVKLSAADCCDGCASNQKTDCINVRKGYLVIIYAVLILAFYSFWSTTYRFLDFTAVSLAAKEDSHYGKERSVAICGPFLTTIIVAFILNINKTSGSKINYDPVIWIAAGLQLCAFFTLCMTEVPILPPGKYLIKKAFALLKDINTFAFIMLVFIAGNGYAINFTLHLVFLEAINAPSIVGSLHTVAIYFYGFPVTLTSKWWLKKFGANKLFILSLLFHALNYAAYSFIVNIWWSLLIDMTIAFSFHLCWVAVVVHCRNIAPAGFAATLNALTGTVHFGLGRSFGVFFEGRLMDYMGARESYQVLAAIFFTTAVLYSIFLFMRRKSLPVNGEVNGDEADIKHYNTTEIPDT